MYNQKELHNLLLSYKGAKLDYPFGENVAVYKYKDKMFALVAEGKEPPTISLKCDPELAALLREKYETIMPGYHLNKKHWNSIVLSGQLGREEVKAFIDHSYQLIGGEL